MKISKIYIIVIFAAALTSCSYFNKEKVEVVSAKLKVTTETSFDINTAQMGPKQKKASVNGEIKNISENTLIDILITYKFPRGRVTAKVKKLKPGQTRKFFTTMYKTQNPRPSFKLDKIEYEIIK